MNTNNYNYLNAINLATCGAWEDTDESLCVAPWVYTNRYTIFSKFSKTPSTFRTKELMSNAMENLDNLKFNVDDITNSIHDTVYSFKTSILQWYVLYDK